MPLSRKHHLALFLLLILLLPFGSAIGPISSHSQTSEKPRLNWYKGNTHTHTLNSDGDSTPDEVVRWYREHGYNFLVLTDHNFVTSEFIVIRGEEVSDEFRGNELYVRAKVFESNGKIAWVQPAWRQRAVSN